MAECNTCHQETFRYTVRLGEEGEYIECLACGRGVSGYRPFKAYWDNHIAEQPVYIENDRQRERLMREQNLSVRPREHIDDLNHRRFTRGLPPLEK